jgi:hypothetical protein
VAEGSRTAGRAVADIVLYSAARLVLVAAVAAGIYGVAWLVGVHDFPVLVAVLFALVIAMPLGMWLFAPLRRRATAGLEASMQRRRRDREQLRARLRGQAPHDDESSP